MKMGLDIEFSSILVAANFTFFSFAPQGENNQFSSNFFRNETEQCPNLMNLSRGLNLPKIGFN